MVKALVPKKQAVKEKPVKMKLVKVIHRRALYQPCDGKRINIYA